MWMLVVLVVFALGACVQQQAPEVAAGEIATLAAEDLVINEIMQNPAVVGDSSGEWFEIFNSGTTAVDIDGWTIADAGSDSHVIANGGPLNVPAGGYVVLGNNGDTGTKGGVAVDYVYGEGFFLSNGDDELTLATSTGTESDRVEWDGGPAFPDPNGASMALIDPALDNNVGENWCVASTPYGSGDLGTPGEANDCAGEVPILVINEIMQNPAAVGDSAGEWFELYNPGEDPVDIDGWTIQDNDTDSHVIANGGPLVVPAGGFLVLGNNGDSATNGGVAVDYMYASIALANGADELVLITSSATEVDRVEWDGGATFPDPTGASMALIDPVLDNELGENWCTAGTSYGAGDLGTPGAANDCDVPPPPPAIGVCGDPATLIHTIQGSGFASPLDGVDVVIEGVVVGDFQAGDGDLFDTDLEGFHVQEEDGDRDGDSTTSEGIFVFAPAAPDVSVGDVVRVGGTVDEFFNLTELANVTAVSVCDTGASVTPTPLELPLADMERESVEGMLVTFTQDLAISEYFAFGRFGEIVLALPNPAGENRQFTPTSFVEPGPLSAAVAEENALRRITLDDGRSVQNPDPARHPNGAVFDLGNRFRGGDLVTNATGVMDYRFGLYRVQPTVGADYVNANPRPVTHEVVGGELEVAAFNVLNYFTTLGSRGADTPEEFDRQRDKIIAALVAIDADVVGLIEIENNTAAIGDLVDGLNSVLGVGAYDFIDTGVIGPDAIKVAFIYKPSSVTARGDFAVLDTQAFMDPRNLGDAKNRPALAQAFEQHSDGAVFTAVVNHLKSKGSSCGEGDDDPQQGNCNLTRTLAAQELLDWLATDPTGSGDDDFLILGDLNAYDEEDPIDVMKAGGFTDLGEVYEGEFAYTYVFDGQFGHLDYAMANSSLESQVTGATNWHINADEPNLLDYDTTFKQDPQDDLYEPDPFRSSDHDPVIVGLDLNASPTCDTAEPSRAVLWSPTHEMETIEILGVTDPEGDSFAIIIDSIFQDEPVDAVGAGDGRTSPDGAGVGTGTAEVRAERSARGNGRVYHVGFTATDEHGASCSGTVLVSVPRDQGRNAAAVDDGAMYDSTQNP
jgi:predicted extracellular nuclease